MLPASLLGKASESVDLTHKVRNDPFSVLPYDVLLDIFERVDTKDMLSLMKASHHIDTTTRENAFWKHMIRIRVLPWFSELRSFVESTISDAIDYKGLFLWIDHLTRPEFGNQGPLIGMAVANRRRIWSAVQDLVPLYKSRVAPPISPLQPEDTKEAQNILDSAVCIHMPLTLFPLPKESTPISTQFIKSWNEISHSSCDFDTFWDKKDGPYFPVLIGISVTFPGHQPRIFGSTQGTPGNPLHIEAGLWIRQIVLRIDEVDMFHHDQDRSMVEGKADARPKWDAGITGMQVVLSSGKEKDVKSSHRGHQRPMVVCEGMCLIGLTGEVASVSLYSPFLTPQLLFCFTPWRGISKADMNPTERRHIPPRPPPSASPALRTLLRFPTTIHICAENAMELPQRIPPQRPGQTLLHLEQPHNPAPPPPFSSPVGI
jgi:hypothetical protein